jgi:hypothetical protein
MLKDYTLIYVAIIIMLGIVFTIYLGYPVYPFLMMPISEEKSDKHYVMHYTEKINFSLEGSNLDYINDNVPIEDMHIYYERSGGIEGTPLYVNFSLDSLPLMEQTELKEMIATSNFYDLSSNTTVTKGAADYFEYMVTIKTDGKKNTVRVTDITMPKQLVPLISFLTQKAISSFS